MSILRDYTHYFMSHIFARGEAIAETDAVEIIISNEKVIEAEVEGTDLYDVRIEVEGNSVEILKVLTESLDETASRAGSVRHYEGIVGRMGYIQSLPGGRLAMARKAQEYCYEYRGRPNFMKELRKVDWRVNG